MKLSREAIFIFGFQHNLLYDHWLPSFTVNRNRRTRLAITILISNRPYFRPKVSNLNMISFYSLYKTTARRCLTYTYAVSWSSTKWDKSKWMYSAIIFLSQKSFRFEWMPLIRDKLMDFGAFRKLKTLRLESPNHLR